MFTFLETRLSKVKGSEQNLTSKGMISVLQKARDDYMSRLMSSTNQMASLSSDIDREVSVSYVEVGHVSCSCINLVHLSFINYFCSFK